MGPKGIGPPRRPRICALADAIISKERAAATVAIADVLTIIPLLRGIGPTAASPDNTQRLAEEAPGRQRRGKSVIS
jgi:hypothetical protein